MRGILLSFISLLSLLMQSHHSVLSSNRYRRITGGSQHKIQDIPYLVSLRYNKLYYCGGSIIGDLFILTAASCEKPEVKKIKVRIGSSFYQKKGKTIRAKKFIPHPDFNNETLAINVAIIVLQEQMNFTRNIKPVLLPPPDKKMLPKPGEFVRIAGWGYYDPKAGINSSEELRSVELPMMSTEICRACYPDRDITEWMFCAGYFLGGKGPSLGDIGGPVVYKGIQYGVVSFTGDSGAYPLSPAVFTSVPKVRGFIQRYTKV